MDPRVRVLVAVAQLDRASYYDLLMVERGCDRAALQKGFHRFALAFHPDRHLGEDDEVRVAAKQVFERGVEAYTVLRDPDFARYYDEQLANGAKRLTAEDFDRFARKNRVRQPPARAPSRMPPTPENAFVDAMKTEDGRDVAVRIEQLIKEQRYREAYLQMGLLETVEPNNPAVRLRADKIAAYLKRFGDRGR
jgi:DnaJ-class molecular chaperone